jgi:hypothetical protein
VPVGGDFKNRQGINRIDRGSRGKEYAVHMASPIELSFGSKHIQKSSQANRAGRSWWTSFGIFAWPTSAVRLSSRGLPFEIEHPGALVRTARAVRTDDLDTFHETGTNPTVPIQTSKTLPD